jgi:hypothetical protein
MEIDDSTRKINLEIASLNEIDQVNRDMLARTKSNLDTLQKLKATYELSKEDAKTLADLEDESLDLLAKLMKELGLK